MLNVKVYDINLKGTNYEIGYQLGKMIEKDEFLKSKYIVDEPNISTNEVNELNSLLDCWCPGITEELNGFADALNVELKYIYFYNMTYLVPCCSQIALLPEVTAEKKPLLGRNYEFAHNIEDYCLMKTSVLGKYTHIGTSMLQFGRDEGLNEHGLAITISSCGMPVANLPNMKKPKIKGLQYWVVVRVLLENCKDVKEAIAYLDGMPIAFNMNMILLDKASHLAFVEIMDGKCVIKQIDTFKQQRFYATNHIILPELLPIEPKGLTHSIIRYHYIEQQLNNTKEITKDRLKDMFLSKYPEGLCFHYFLDGFGTTKSLILSPLDGTIEVCWGGRVENTWRQYNIIDIFHDKVYEIELYNERMPKRFFQDYQAL